MSGNISEVSASLSSNSDIVPDMDVVVPPRLLPPPPEAPQKNAGVTMSGNISEVSASSSSKSDSVPSMGVVVPARQLPPPVPQLEASVGRIIGSWCHPNDDDEGENDTTRQLQPPPVARLQAPLRDIFGLRRHPNDDREKRETDTVRERKEEEDKTIKDTFVVATLIATITFAAGFTLPGGTIQDGEHKGSPILQHNTAFQAFVLTDCIAMVLSASAVLIYLFTTVDEVRKNKKRYMSYGMVATRLTMLAMVSMMIAFLAGTYAVLGVGDSNSIGVVTLLIGLSFFLVLGILVWKSNKYIRDK